MQLSGLQQRVQARVSSCSEASTSIMQPLNQRSVHRLHRNALFQGTSALYLAQLHGQRHTPRTQHVLVASSVPDSSRQTLAEPSIPSHGESHEQSAVTSAPCPPVQNNHDATSTADAKTCHTISCREGDSTSSTVPEGSTASSTEAAPAASLQDTNRGETGAKNDSGLPHVPWGLGKVVQVMVLWLLAYITIGQVAVPIALSLLGLDRDELSMRGQAILHLCLDMSQLASTVLILWQCLKEYEPIKRGFFPVRLRGLWPLVVLCGCLLFPGVDWVAQQCMTWFPPEMEWANHVEHSLTAGDWVTNVAYFGVVSLCAPIWEEAIFRGFLLTSLTRHLPKHAAVAASSLLFALCHFRLQTFLPLLLLGAVFSYVFLTTRNLLPPVVLHSAWNVFVLYNLLFRPG